MSHQNDLIFDRITIITGDCNHFHGRSRSTDGIKIYQNDGYDI